MGVLTAGCGVAGAGSGTTETKSAAPVTLLMLTERTAADLAAQKELLGRLTQDQPHVEHVGGLMSGWVAVRQVGPRD